MDIYKFISAEVLRDRDPRPERAFVDLIGCAERRLRECTAGLAVRNKEHATLIHQDRSEFMRVLIGFGKALELEPFVWMEVPTQDTYKPASYGKFLDDLDQFIAKAALQGYLYPHPSEPSQEMPPASPRPLPEQGAPARPTRPRGRRGAGTGNEPPSSPSV